MWEYHGIDHNNDFLQHWKYTRRETKNGRWQYYYDNGKNTVPYNQVKAQQNNNAGYRRAQTHGKTARDSRNNTLITIGKKTAGEQIKSGINRKVNQAKLTARNYANKGKRFLEKIVGPTTTTKTTGVDKNGNAYVRTRTGNRIFATERTTTAISTTPKKKKRK